MSGLDEKVAEKRITTFAEFARLFLGFFSNSRQVLEVYVIIINCFDFVHKKLLHVGNLHVDSMLYWQFVESLTPSRELFLIF